MTGHEPSLLAGVPTKPGINKKRPQHARTWDYGELGDEAHRAIANRVVQFFRVLDKLDREYFPELYQREEEIRHGDANRTATSEAHPATPAPSSAFTPGKSPQQDALAGENPDGRGTPSGPDAVNNHLLALARLVAREMATAPRMSEPAPKQERLLIGANEVGKLMGIAPRTVWRLTSAGHLPQPIKLGGRSLWHRSTLEDFLTAKIKEGERVSRRQW